MMNAERKGGWLSTRTGKRFYPLDPRPEDVDIRDIAHHLAANNRFAGATVKPYCVAQHCVLVSLNVPHHLAWHGLMHDSPEFVMIDLPRPIKVALPEYKKLEHGVWLAICEKFGRSSILSSFIKEVDNRMLSTERRDLLGKSKLEYCETETVFRPYDFKIKPWSFEYARMRFLDRFNEVQIP